MATFECVAPVPTFFSNVILSRAKNLGTDFPTVGGHVHFAGMTRFDGL